MTTEAIRRILPGRQGDPNYKFYDNEDLLAEYYARSDAERNPDLSFRDWLFRAGYRGAEPTVSCEEAAIKALRDDPELRELLGL